MVPPSAKGAAEVLYDSAATLRLVDCALRDLDATDDASTGLSPAAATGARDALVEEGHRQLLGVLDSLRQGRSVLQRAAGDAHVGASQAGRGTASDEMGNASAILDEVEQRLAAIVSAFEPIAAPAASSTRPEGLEPPTF